MSNTRKTNEQEFIIELTDGGTLLIPEVNPQPTLPDKEEATVPTTLGPDYLGGRGGAPGQNAEAPTEDHGDGVNPKLQPGQYASDADYPPKR